MATTTAVTKLAAPRSTTCEPGALTRAITMEARARPARLKHIDARNAAAVGKNFAANQWASHASSQELAEMLRTVLHAYANDSKSQNAFMDAFTKEMREQARSRPDSALAVGLRFSMANRVLQTKQPNASQQKLLVRIMAEMPA